MAVLRFVNLSIFAVSLVLKRTGESFHYFLILGNYKNVLLMLAAISDVPSCLFGIEKER